MLFVYLFLGLVALGAVVFIIILILNSKKKAAQQELLGRVLEHLSLNEDRLDMLSSDYHKDVVVKSRQTLEKYSFPSLFKENRDYFDLIREYFKEKEDVINLFRVFLKDNPFVEEKEYKFIQRYIDEFISTGVVYVVRVRYISSAGNWLDTRYLRIRLNELNEIENTPELYMTKTEIREIEKSKLEDKKKKTYARVDGIIEKANTLKDSLLVKKDENKLDELIANLFDRTVNSIQKIKAMDSEEWTLILKVIDSIQSDIDEIAKKNDRLVAYYSSDEFKNIKKTCVLLMQSQKEFNSYIEEKIENISKLFGTRIVRNETNQEDVYNYVRPYKKTVSPFTAELSSSVFASAENNPIQYLIKCFYPNKAIYNDQIVDLKNLLNELESLKDAKKIIDNYKKEYTEYIVNVPKYVLEDDEDGFYYRLGFAVIDENVLNVEYKFVYTSNGGFAQRSFSIPMTEENIAELINQLQSKLSLSALAKEQRALMTPKLREAIKGRDNYTCRLCGNSTHIEPNLLLEIDHIVPIAKGGLTVESNLQTLCWKCNRNKGAKLV